jgi:hypothetical protein
MARARRKKAAVEKRRELVNFRYVAPKCLSLPILPVVHILGIGGEGCNSFRLKSGSIAVRMKVKICGFVGKRDWQRPRGLEKSKIAIMESVSAMLRNHRGP